MDQKTYSVVNYLLGEFYEKYIAIFVYRYSTFEFESTVCKFVCTT